MVRILLELSGYDEKELWDQSTIEKLDRCALKKCPGPMIEKARYG